RDGPGSADREPAPARLRQGPRRPPREAEALAPGLPCFLRARRLRGGPRARRLGGAAAELVELGLDAVADPVGVPPLPRVDLRSLEDYAEVKVVAAGEPGLAGLRDRLGALHRVVVLHVERAQVAVERDQTVAVVDGDRVA